MPRVSSNSALSILVLTIVLLVGRAAVHAQSDPRVLLLGDSWTLETAIFESIENAFAKHEIDAEGAVFRDGTTVNGLTAEALAGGNVLERAVRALNENPTIDMVHLNVGGADFLSFYNGERTDEEFAEFSASHVEHMRTILAALLDVRPTIRVLIVEYEFLPILLPDVEDFAAQHVAFATFARTRIDIANEFPRAHYLANMGLFHARFGFPPHFEAGETPWPGQAPDYDPLPGGDPNFGGDERYWRDGTHPNEEGYGALAEHAVDTYYREWYLNPLRQVAIPALGPFGLAALAAGAIGLGAGVLRRRRVD